ncbi:Transposon Tn10 TetC protein [compost metagenome]
MDQQPRAKMIEQTRAKLITSARHAFGTQGYGNTSMDDFTAQVGLTRGALYHHFGDKKGLLAAVVAQIDSEMDARLDAISASAGDPWSGFCQRCTAYLYMAQEHEIQRILLLDAPAVLGDLTLSLQLDCVATLRRLLEHLMEHHFITPAPPEALARLINGSLVQAALWIARDEAPAERLHEALQGLEVLLRGLRSHPPVGK